MRSLDVRARHAASDMPDLAWRDAVILGDVGACARVGADGANVVVGKLGGRKVLSLSRKAVDVANVLPLASPAQVSRVDATRVAAIAVKGEMVRGIGPLSSVERKGNVGRIVGSIGDGERAVSVRDYRASPDPAVIRSSHFDLGEVIRFVDAGGVHSFHAAMMPQNPKTTQGAI